MRILFINLPLDIYPANNRIEKYNTIPPYGLGYIASVASNYIGRENIKIIDAEYKGLSIENICKEIEKFRPNILSINVCSANFFVFEALIDILPKKYEGKIIVGGPHAILCPEDFFSIHNRRFIKFVCLGEGEIVFTQFLLGYNIQTIENICYMKDDGTLSFMPKQTKINFDAFDLDRTFFENDLFYKDGLKRSYMVTSRGCPNNCAFCAAPHIYHHWFFLRSKDSLKRELQKLKQKGVNHIRFIDDLFLCSTNRILEFIEIFSELGLNKNNFSFEATGRIDIISKFDESVWEKLSMYGLSEIEIGIESGSQRILNLMNKNISIHEIFNTVKKCIFYGIKVKAFIICGYYTESVKELEETITLCKNLKQLAKNKIRFSATPAKAYPGTLLYNQIISYGHIIQQQYMYIDLSQYWYTSDEKTKIILKSRTRYNAVHQKLGFPLFLSDISGGADASNVIKALIKIELISKTGTESGEEKCLLLTKI